MTAQSSNPQSLQQAFSLGNGQDAALNWLRKNQTHCAIFLTNGIKLEGMISAFDQYSILLSDPRGQQQLIYKAKISTISPATRRPPRTGVIINKPRRPRYDSHHDHHNHRDDQHHDHQDDDQGEQR
ncbi:RNA chaperone Hfq [Zobellella denitrificans]|jgi:host factor-I protein|uniref:RNA-binding protein Hfq n=1 Tax=Zobellella denitrificans TaxID=347534 RepID=A0A231MXC4_9GAMM|nr:RNA chaperone Hfq [Zobellella denitrificans]ATG75184.1 RNA chaperone Hfq [Zobellella denitrificans]OXS14827.1 RNA chaperone Hfq [Zobellella denitrificans]